LLQFIRSLRKCHPVCCAFLLPLKRTPAQVKLSVGVQFHPFHQLDTDRRARGGFFHRRFEKFKSKR
jgi:hypothetical protein